MSLTVTDYGLGIFNFISPSQTIPDSAWTILGTPTSSEIDATTTIGGVTLTAIYLGSFNVASIPASAKTLADIPFFSAPNPAISLSSQGVYVNNILAQKEIFTPPVSLSTFQSATLNVASANAIYSGAETFISSSNNWTNDCVFGYNGAATYVENHPLEPVSYNDVFVGGSGGVNTAVMPAPYKNFSLSVTAVFDANTGQNDLSGFTLSDQSQAVNTLQLSGVQRIQFSDGVLALDWAPGQSAFKAGMLVCEAFGAAKLSAAFPQALAFEDSGQNDIQACVSIEQMGLIESQIGSTADTAFVDFLYLNATGKPIDAGSEAQFITALQNGTYTRASLLAYAVAGVESGFGNMATQIGLSGLQSTGLFFHPVPS